ncbi:MAG: hypothetical protein WA897_08095 [Moheibacter sp.]
MKYVFFIIICLTLIGCNNQSNHSKIKSVTKTINGVILERQEFDINQNLVFEKHNQINYGKENSIIFMSAMIYDEMNNLILKYYANSNWGMELFKDSLDFDTEIRIKGMGNYREIKEMKNYRQTLFSIDTKTDFIDFFKKNYPKNTPFDYETFTSDTIITKTISHIKNDTLIIETTKIQNDFIIDYSKEFYNKNKKKIKKITKGEYNRLIELIYDEKGLVIRQNEKGQHYQFYYKDSLLTKKELYHNLKLAFSNEYFYENGILIKEIKYRITDSKYFQRVPEKQTVLYQYEYY